MRVIYEAVIKQLKEKVRELKWIDLDDGQIDTSQRPAIAYPCALVGIDIYSAEDVYSTTQVCTANIRVRIIQDNTPKRTSAQTSDAVRSKALQAYDLIEKVFVNLQGFETDQFCALSRTRQTKETHPDGLFVYRLEFSTSFEDNAANT